MSAIMLQAEKVHFYILIVPLRLPARFVSVQIELVVQCLYNFQALSRCVARYLFALKIAS